MSFNNNARENIYYTYDLNGNLIKQDVTSNGSHYWFDYEFNELNQLVRVRKNNGLIAEYFYDHAGLRYKKIDYVTSKTTIYVYGEGTEPLYEEVYNNANLANPTNKVSYLNLGNQRLAKVDNSMISYYFTDNLGNIRIIDSSGHCIYIDYHPFGRTLENNSSERYKFTGKEEENLIGLYYFNARYYDSEIGRFLTEDLKKDGFNWYVYCRNNPLKFIDPSGYWTDPLSKMKIRRNLVNHTFGMVRNGGTKAHTGIDLYAKEGTKTVAVTDAKVYSVVINPNDKVSYGNYVLLQYEDKGKTYYALYAHLSTVNVKPGDTVKEGSVIGLTGNSGNAWNMKGDDEHLHFELLSTPNFYKGMGLNNRFDPMLFMNAFNPSKNQSITSSQPAKKSGNYGCTSANREMM